MGTLIPIKIHLDRMMGKALAKPQAFLSDKEKRAIRYAAALNKNHKIVKELNKDRIMHGMFSRFKEEPAEPGWDQ